MFRLSMPTSACASGDWAYWAGSPDRVHDEIAGKTIGLLGFGHIGKAIAGAGQGLRDEGPCRQSQRRADLRTGRPLLHARRAADFWGSADFIVVSVPLTAETRASWAPPPSRAMQPDARASSMSAAARRSMRRLCSRPCASKRIGGAIIDTWYRYPERRPSRRPLPATLPFHELSNVVMTPHMSGWTSGTIRRRQQTIADNIKLRFDGGKPSSMSYGKARQQLTRSPINRPRSRATKRTIREQGNDNEHAETSQDRRHIAGAGRRHAGRRARPRPSRSPTSSSAARSRSAC